MSGRLRGEDGKWVPSSSRRERKKVADERGQREGTEAWEGAAAQEAQEKEPGKRL